MRTNKEEWIGRGRERWEGRKKNRKGLADERGEQVEWIEKDKGGAVRGKEDAEEKGICTEGEEQIDEWIGRRREEKR